MNPPSPWHAGELAMQRSIGVVEQMDRPGRMFVRDLLTDQHRGFYPLLDFVAIGSVDAHGDAWATARAGLPGFLQSPDPATLRLTLERDPSDPAETGLEDGRAVGLLGIDFMTRRRNRLNGTVRRTDGHGFAVGVEQSFGNCPRYIHPRDFEFVRDPAVASPQPVTETRSLDARARHIVRAADTFFVASYVDRGDGVRQVDVSHRGGPPGFVRVEPDGSLTIPDFSGNRFFMTLGNFRVNPKAGLLFIDPGTGDMLQMTGDARVLPGTSGVAAFEGAERLWSFGPRRVLYRPAGLPSVIPAHCGKPCAKPG